MVPRMPSYQYDVVVVGAGPSGSMTARYAAAGGCRTLLIEKRQEIGSPGRCAGFKTLLKAGDITATLQYRLTNISEGHDFPDYCEFWLGTCAPAGYIWVFPKDESTANVGIGISLDRLKNRVDIKGYLDRWIEQDPRMAHAQPLDMVTGGVSTAPPIKKSVGNGMALVGDAARMIDPITGGGIGNGMLAGMMLGKVLSKCNQTGDFGEAALMEYERGWRAKLEENLYRNWLAKNKLVTLSDREFDDIIQVLAEVGVTKLSVRAILKVLKETRPELVAKFAEFI